MSEEGRRSSKEEEVVELRTIIAGPASRNQTENVSHRHSLQDGVKSIEGISLSWTRRSLIVAYCSIMLMAITTSLEGQTTGSLFPYAIGSFPSDSLVVTITIVGGVVRAVVLPLMAKVADVFGRLNAFYVSVGFFVLGYIQMAALTNVNTFASAQIFYSAGSTGLLIVQQIFIADTSDLSNRALFSTLPDLPFLATPWIGSLIGEGIVASSGSWRIGYGMWTIILPAAFLPLGLLLFLNGRNARALGLAPQRYSTLQGGFLSILSNLWRDLDIGGIILLSGGLTLILVPCAIVTNQPGGWSNSGIMAMVTLGSILLVLFPFWEISSRFARERGMTGKLGTILKNLAPYPLIPLQLLRSRTFSAGSALAIFYFMAFYLSVQPYFSSYLLVVRNLDEETVNNILKIFYISATVSSILVSLLIKLTNHYKWFVVAGSCLYTLGIGLMLGYRGDNTRVIVFTQTLIGFGGGMLNVPAQVGVQASAGHQHVGTATAIFLTLISLGGAIGSAISRSLWEQLVPEKLEAHLPSAIRDQAATISTDLLQARSYTMGSPERDAINQAYQETTTTLLIIAICICVPIISCSLIMESYPLSRIEQGVKGRVIGGAVDENEQKLGDRRSYVQKALERFRGRV